MTAPRRALALHQPDRLARLHASLDAVRARCDAEARRRLDPVGFVHGYRTPLAQEIAGLVAACCAFGNVTTIRGKLQEFRERTGEDLVAHGDDLASLRTVMRGFRHRLYHGEDLAHLVHGARIVQARHGSLGAAFASRRPDLGLAEALGAFVDELRSASRFPASGERRGPAHLLPDPRSGSASKRLLLYLRWMVRPADGVDLGLWPVAPRVLLMPVDVHVHKLARNLGLTKAASPSWKVAEEITATFRRFDPDDPVKYDFALCHLGMASRCSSRFDAEVCPPCEIREVCRHGARKLRQSSTERAVRAKVRART
jgi:uncharacterized protein (TIGR02757 family)